MTQGADVARSKESSMVVALSTIGVATVVALIVGFGGWLLLEFVGDASRSEAIRMGSSAAGAVLLIGAVVGVVRSLRLDR